MTAAFSIKKAFSVGWEVFKKHWILWIIAVIAMVLVKVLSSFFSVDGFFASQSGVVAVIATVLISIMSVIINMSVLVIADKQLRGEATTPEDIFAGCKSVGHFFSVVALSIISGLVVMVGLLLLVIPGVIFMLMFSMAYYYVVIDRLGPIEAMKKSAQVTRGQRVRILGFFLLFGLVFILGMWAFIVGVMVAIPVTTIAGVYVFRKLDEAAGEAGTAVQSQV